MGGIQLSRVLSPSNEDYLEAIFDLSFEQVPVRSIDVATRLNVSRASVNKAVGLLKESGFVTQQPYGGILLTEEGKAVAAKVRMCHTTIKILLQQLFGVPKETAEAEACKIEHVISDDTLSRLIDFVKKNFDKNLMTNVHANYDIKSNIYGNLPQAEDGVAV
ncbi:MAG: metal-dependent transcriptional regulator [Eubacteriales bacterium]